MDDVKKANLRKQRDKIVKDLQVEDILDELYTAQILNADDVDSIRKISFRKDQAIELLHLLAKKDNRAYDTLVIVLRKDYDWLSKALHTVDNDNHDNLIQEAFQDTLVLGDVPRRPPHYVERVDPLHDLRKHLEELQPCQRIVLHGMTGSGKSCLAAAAVKDADLLQTHFHNRVFWINLGEIKTIHQLPSHMTVLLQRLTNDTRAQNKRRPVSLLAAQEGDIIGEIQLLKDGLKNLFCHPYYRDALLVLDNVSLQEATEAFDVGCKTLITTQDKDIIVGNNTIYMQVKGGFTEMETLLLFANSLHTAVERLPLYANKIHHLCKGEPILIALIGSLLEPYKEDLLSKSDHWVYYIKKLTKKDYNLKDKLFRAIKICIEGLDDELGKLYQSFSVFVEDVNITPYVMQTLWNLDDIYAVQDKMTELQNKSLIVSYYNTELKTYVYGIHDLFLAYLKSRLGADGIVHQHRKLISAYQGISNNNYANLPNDNYIFQYIGYHLKEARLESEFKVYFDLNFIAAKIKAIGIADLLRDFHVYREYITHNDEDLINKLNEYVKFIKSRGHDLFKYPDTDIVQAGLGQNKDSSIYRAALAISKDNPKSLYFQLQSPQESVYFTHTLDLSHDVSAACFTGDVNQILVGMTNGDINMWEQAYNQKLYIFSGHTDSIMFLQLSPDRNGFLSVSADGSVKIWCLKGVVLKSSNGDTYDENGFNKHIPSPRVKQSNWTNFYGTNGRIDHSKTCRLMDINDKLISASYANEIDYQIVTGCTSGKVLIWTVLEDEPTIILPIPGRGEPVNCVIFSGDDTLVIFSCGTSIFVHDAEKGDFLSQFHNRATVRSLLVVPELDTTLVAMHDSTVTMWTWNQIGSKVLQPAMTELDIKGSAKFLCGAVTEDGMYFVAGSDDYYIRIWHIGTAKIVQEILNNKGLVVCLDTFYDDTKNAVHILLSGSDDKTVKQWHIHPTLQVKDTAKLLPIFDCYWNNLSGIPRIAVVNSINKVQIMHGHNLIIESDIMNSPIKALRFSLCGNKIAIGLENGNVKEFDYKNRCYDKLMNLHGSVMLLKYFNMAKDPNCRNCSKNDLLSEKVILVATGQNGWVSVYKNGRALCLVQPSALNLAGKHVPVIPIVQCFYITAADKLLTVSQNRTIKSWNIDNGIFTTLYGDKIQNDASNSTVTMATLSPDQALLAITMNDGCFEIYSLNVDESLISLIYNQGKNLNNPLWSCRFSHNSKILAVGQDDGQVVIWSVESKVIIGVLNCSKYNVRYLLFSPSPGLILVSVGEQIVWWDITKLSDNSHNGNRNYRRRSSSAKKDLTISLTAQMTNMNLGMWNDKEGKADKPHLLSAIKVRGLYSTYISASHDFTSFFTIDTNGYLYIMEMLKQSHF